MFEIDGCTDEVAKRALTLAGSKLSVKTKIVKKEMDGDQDEDK
jgi:large subunit ribosomal protein L16